MAYFTVNGTDILPYIEDGGFNWDSNDIDSSDAGRTLDAVMHRGKIAEKATWSIKCRPLKPTESAIVLSALQDNEYVQVATDVHPRYASVVMTMYNSKRSAKCMTIYPDGTAVWEDISFNLIEQ